MADLRTSFESSLDAGIRLARAGTSNTLSQQRAFALEAVLLALLLAASLAVVSATFVSALTHAYEARELSVAATLASGGAETGLEAFAADPEAAAQMGEVSSFYLYSHGALTGSTGVLRGDEYQVRRTVEAEPTAAGTLYTAHVTVLREGRQIYEVSSAAYVSGREG